MYRIFWSLFCAVNYGVLLLQAILEHWPETFSGTVDEADQDFPRADSPGLSVLPAQVSLESQLFTSN